MTSLTRTRNRNLSSLQREIDRVFDAFFPSSDANGDSTSTQAVWAPRADLLESDTAYHIHLDVPGVSRDDLKISFQDNQLVVSGERQSEVSQEEADRVRVERTFGHFYRSFTLPRTVDADGIEASFDSGVLRISVPKTEESRPRQIEIQ